MMKRLPHLSPITVIKFAIASILVLVVYNFAFAGTLERNRFTIVYKKIKYVCSPSRTPAIPIFKRSGKYMTGADALKNLKRDLRRKSRLNTRVGRREIRNLETLIKNGKRACASAVRPTPTPSVPASLAKITRPLTRSDVQYFLDKAGFGLSPIEEPLVSKALKDGVDGLVTSFMTSQAEDDGLLSRVANRLDGNLDSDTTQTPAGQRQALLDLLIHTRNPYQEKLALFLLSVWTTAGDVISDETFRGAWWDYYQRLRISAASDESLADLGVALTRGPMMLVYLNNELNINVSPNENYARELLELFTLGTTDADGNANYTETKPDGSGDIAVAARMLTGWKVTRNYSTNKLVASYQSNRHSPGPHTMFAGQSFSFQGENDEDLVRGIFTNHPQAKNYYAREVLKVYLTPSPSNDLVTAFGQVIADRGFRIRDALKVLFSSEAFFDRRFKDTVPMNSLEFAAKAARMLRMFGAVNISEAEYQLRNMGMQVNMAPSVFWYSPNTWTSSSVALERANYLAQLMGDSALTLPDPDWSIAALLPSGAATPQKVVEYAANILGVTDLTAGQVDNYVGYFNKRLQYNGLYLTVPYNNTVSEHQNLKGLGCYYLLMISPEFQLL